MKKTIALMLILALLICALTGCSGSGGTPSATPTPQPVSFVPETTAVATGGLAQALASVGGSYNGAGDDIDEEAEIAEKSLEASEGNTIISADDNDGNTIVEAEVPMAEMSSYAIDLRAMTQARGSFTLTFERYEEVPKANQAKIIAEAKEED